MSLFAHKPILQNYRSKRKRKAAGLSDESSRLIYVCTSGEMQSDGSYGFGLSAPAGTV